MRAKSGAVALDSAVVVDGSRFLAVSGSGLTSNRPFYFVFSGCCGSSVQINALPGICHGCNTMFVTSS